MARTTHRSTYTMMDRTYNRIADLAKWWGSVEALSDSGVIREAIDRAWEAESKARYRNGKKNLKNPD